MNLRMMYTTPSLFSLGELRALVVQTSSLPDEAVVYLKGTVESDEIEAGADAMIIEWEDA